MSLLDPIAGALLDKLSPSGALAEVAASHANAALEAEFARFDAIDAAVQRHLAVPGLVARLEDDFASCVPAISDAAVPLAAWAIPLLSALAGPAAPLLSFGLQVAVKLALAALVGWAKRRAAPK